MTHDHKKREWGKLFLFGPTALIAAALAAYVLAHFVLEAIGASKTLSDGINLVLFSIGAAGATIWLPGIVVGIILLATRKQSVKT